MQHIPTSRIGLPAAALLALTLSSPAQWATDPALNLALGDSASDQNQAQIAPTPDGGAWISWFDGIGSGWDVRVQKVDASGNELFAHNGILVADRGFSSTQGYGLDVDSSGNALLTFRDDSVGGTQITAAKVTTAGTLAWGPTGVQLTSTTAFVANPKITGTSDGGAVIAWTQDATSRVQKLDSAGVAQWMADVVLTPAVGSYSVADLHDSGTDAILSMVHITGNFLAPKHLVTQKFDSTGAALWGMTPVNVFDSGSLQIGNFPPFVPDGAGGGVFAWYTSSPLQCFVQRIDGSGAELFPHNGVPVSNNASQVRTDPGLAFDASSGDSYVFWTEQNGTQSMFGLSGQRIDSTGSLQWGSSGATLIPLGSDEVRQVRTIADPAGGALVVWDQSPAFAQDQLFGTHVDLAGSVDVATFPVASTPSGKSRLAAAPSANGFAILAWSDARTDGGDIYAQNVNFDGSLGESSGPGTDLCNGDGGDQMGCTDCPCANNAPAGTIGGCLNSAGTSTAIAASGSTSVSLPSGATTDLRFTLSGAPSSAFCVLLSGDAVAPQNMANPCFGMSSGALAVDRDGLRCAVQGTQRHGGRSANSLGDIADSAGPSRVWGGEAQPAAGLAGQGGFVAGQTRYFQVTHREDAMAVCMRGLNTSQAIGVSFTP